MVAAIPTTSGKSRPSTTRAESTADVITPFSPAGEVHVWGSQTFNSPATALRPQSVGLTASCQISSSHQLVSESWR